jgi:hypothetical protein
MKRKLEEGALINHVTAFGYRRDTGVHASACSQYRCRVLVSKERLGQKWPTEKDGPEGAAFRKFAARLADAVQKALAEGVTISPRRLVGCRCPLGTLTEAPHPDAWQCKATGALGFHDAVKFFRAFDGQHEDPDSPYYRLGQAYRARFVTNKAAE